MHRFNLLCNSVIYLSPCLKVFFPGVPAGALHGYFYDDTRPNYLNYGTVGTTIAQQLIQAMYFSILKNVSHSRIEYFINNTQCLSRCLESELVLF